MTRFLACCNAYCLIISNISIEQGKKVRRIFCMDGSQNLPLQAMIKFLTGPLTGRCFLISKATTTVGRDPTNDIVVEQDQRVSRYHARLLWSNGEWSIENVSQKAQL